MSDANDQELTTSHHSESELLATLLNQKTSKNPSMIDNFKQLFCNPKHSVNFFKCLILFIVTFNLLYMSIFNVRKTEGNMFINYIIFFIGLSFGTLSSGLLLQMLEDTQIFLMSLFIMLTVSFIRQISENPSVAMVS